MGKANVLATLQRAGARAVTGTLERASFALPTVGRPLTELALPTSLTATRNPVVLIGGYSCSGRIWDVWKRSLARDGFDVHVFEVPGNALGSVWDDARALGRFIDTVQARTGAAKVDLVGYSKGGLIARAHTNLLGGADDVDSIVTVATPHGGIDVGGITRTGPVTWLLPEPVRQMLAGSDFLTRLNAPGAQRVPVTAIYSQTPDLVIFPAGCGALEGARNIAITTQGGLLRSALDTNHFSLLTRNHEAYEAARAALLRLPPSV